MTRILRLLSACLLLLPACDGGSKETDDTGRPGGGDDSGGGGDDTGTELPDPEADCEDGLDNDTDGLADCDDSDCAEAFRCTWPDTIQHETDVLFDGYTVVCETWIGDFEEEVADCRTHFTSPLSVVADAGACPTCDRTYQGSFTYTVDNCDELTGDGARPTEGRFGFVFLSPTERELWSQDAKGVWAKAVTMTVGGDGVWRHSDSGEVTTEAEDCDNSPLTLGNLTVSLAFTDQ